MAFWALHSAGHSTSHLAGISSWGKVYNHHVCFRAQRKSRRRLRERISSHTECRERQPCLLRGEEKREAVDYPLFTKLAAEFFGTAILMIFGNGSVANVELKNTKGHHAGWLNIAMGYGFGVMFPVLMFGSVSGAHINPAMTIAQAVNGLFPWSDVLPYIVAQLLGALLGQLIVYITYYPHYKETEDAEAILGTFCTTDADNQKANYFLNEMFGTLVLVFGALCCLSLAWGKQDYAAASIVVGFIVWGLVTSMGGPTGPGLNPARDLMPRLLHAILPIPHKGSSRWGEAWIPVVAPIVGAIIGAWLFVFFFAS